MNNYISTRLGQLTKPIKWHGGKHYLAKWIISHMPRHVHYVEPFFGGGSVLFAKNPTNTSEVVNDIYAELANFWNVLRSPDEFEQLQRLLEATPLSEPLFHDVCDFETPAPDDSPVIRAFRFFVRYRQSRQGLGKDFATLTRNRTRRGMNEQASSWLTAIEGLPAIHERLRSVVIQNSDAIKVIRKQDGTNTLFYCDPPYLHGSRVTTNDYKHEMTPEQHVELLECLSCIEGKFLLSGYRSQLYDDCAIQNGWHREERQIDNKASSKKIKDIKTEILWMNFHPIVQPRLQPYNSLNFGNYEDGGK